MRAAVVMVAVAAIVAPMLAVWARTDPDSRIRFDRVHGMAALPRRWSWSRRVGPGEYVGGWSLTKAGGRWQAAKAVRR